jgi:hypothetical protein
MVKLVRIFVLNDEIIHSFFKNDGVVFFSLSLIYFCDILVQ